MIVIERKLPLFLIVSLFHLFSCVHTHIQTFSGRTFLLGDSIRQVDSIALLMIAPYKQNLDTVMDKVLNVSDVEMVKETPESLLGNFVADLSFDVANAHYHPGDGKKADFSFFNSGGLRASIPKGDVTLRNIYELMPFENELVVLTLSGKKCEQLFEYIGRFPDQLVSKLKIVFEDIEPKEVYINGTPFNSNKTYKVVTTDYLADKGDRIAFFENPLKHENIGIKMRDAIIEYITNEKKAGRHLTSAYDERIQYVH